MMESTTVVTEQSWCHRLRGACQGVLFGFVFLGGGVWLLHWNEGRSVRRYRALQEGEKICIDISPSKVLEENDSKLVHFTGKAIPQGNVTDNIFGVTPDSSNAIKLKRDVTMYQWVESSHSTTSSGKSQGSTTTTTTYTYKQSFESHLINSASFHDSVGHENPSYWPYETKEFFADSVHVDNITISRDMISKMNWYESIGGVTKDTIYDDSIRNRTDNFEGGLYIGEEPGNPQIGDIRIQFKALFESDVSIVAEQRDNTIAPYPTSNGNTIFLLMRGIHTAQELFIQAERENILVTWGLRLLGTLLVYIGLRMITAPVVVIADIVPWCGDIVGVGTDLVSTILAGIISTLTIAISWIYYRPVLGGIILLLTACIAFFGMKKAAEYKGDATIKEVAQKVVDTVEMSNLKDDDLTKDYEVV